jgi:hypothetical protein
MALTVNREVNRFVDQELRVFPVAASQHVFKGALVGVDRSDGYVRHLTAGDLFVGIAYEEMDNGAGQDGERSVRVYTEGDFILSIGGATQASIGSAVYATGDESVALTTTPGGSYVGTLVGLDSAGEGIVRLRPMATPQIEHAVNVALASLTTAATTNPVLIAQRPIKVLHAQVSFNTVPDAGLLDVGTDNSDPDEIVNAFNLAGLAPHTPTTLTLFGANVAAGQRIWAKVGQATSTAGVGGVLSIRYIELP